MAGVFETPKVTKRTTFHFTLHGEGNTVKIFEITIKVVPLTAPKISLDVSPSLVSKGEDVTATWSVLDA
ncbi:hypothetical protein HXX01_02040 [Candidatus Nomurabacteria bacterium]|nr:hypothetical protein [Candidatus Nomurabacteria bacterium]